MSLGEKWTTTTPGSVSKLNKVNIISGTGAYLASLTKTEHTLLVCTATGSGFTIDHAYLCSNDGTTTFDLSNIDKHTHASDATGGGIMEVLMANTNIVDSGALLITEHYKEKWSQFTSGTGSISNDSDVTTFERSVLLDTGATSGSIANIKQNSIEMNVALRSWFKTMTRLGTASSLALKVGFGIESLSSADDNQRKYGYELCTTVNNNYFLVSANGTTRSASDTGTAFANTRTSFREEHYPDLGTPKVDLYINEGTAFTKTSHIPTTYANNEPQPDNIFRFSFKNNTAASRTMYVYGVRFVYSTSGDWN